MAPGQKELQEGALNGDGQVRTKWQSTSYLPTPQVREAPAAGQTFSADSQWPGVHFFIAFANVHSVNFLTVANFRLQML